MPIITSLLDEDFYKFTMGNFVFHRFPGTEVEYTFKCRNKIDLLAIAWKLENEIKSLCELKLTDSEIGFLRQQGVFGEDYLEFLKEFKLDFNAIDMPIGKKFELKIKGKWVDTILFETPILSIISETVSSKNPHIDQIRKSGYASGVYRLLRGIDKIVSNDCKFADFGARRRLDRNWHREVLKILLRRCPGNLLGTSNVAFAKEFGLNPIGTQAHEIFAASQRLAPSLRESQKFILEQWLDEYKGKLGIALTDIITMAAFLRDFNYDLATAYQGCRHDSGDPYIWGNKLVAHYEILGIDPMNKTAVFSDGLTFDDMVEINSYFKGKINVVFGIGTNLTNNVGITPANIVIKLTKVNGQPVAKISDSPGKSICDDQGYLQELRETFSVS